MTNKAAELMGILNFDLVTFGPNKGKMQITAKPTADSKRAYNELARGMWKSEVQEIKASLTAEHDAKVAAADAKRAKIDAIEGLNELRKAINDIDRYHRAFDRMMEDENNDGVRPPKRPTMNVEELKAKYPRAAAYLKAEKFATGAHYVKANAGSKALDKIINGEDYTAAIAEMEAEWSEYCANQL